MASWNACPIAVATLIIYVRLLRKYFRGLHKATVRVVLHEPRCKGVDSLRGDGFRKNNQKMVTAASVRIEQERMEPPLLQFGVPPERCLGVGCGEGRLSSPCWSISTRNHRHVDSAEIGVQADQIALVVPAIVVFDNLGRQDAWHAEGLLLEQCSYCSSGTRLPSGR